MGTVAGTTRRLSGIVGVNDMNHTKILQLLGNETRVRILQLLNQEDSYVEKLACELSLTPATVCYHLKKMENVGVVRCNRSQFYMIYSLDPAFLNLTVGQLLAACPIPQKVKEDDKYQKQVIANFFRYGRLTHIPSQRRKREIVVREIAKNFKPQTQYTEDQVNDIIHKYHSDHCTIRREMVMMGLLVRKNNLYWVEL